MNIYEEDKSGEIRVADITIAQLSRGLYRSTATAFKELVSNAYDADATFVRIDTNYPEFDFISCVDDGTGMSLEQFQSYFDKEGIGSCIKRKYGKDKTEIYNRPIIGRLGIGMLAIGQLCHSFEIESHYIVNGKGEAYWAEIVLLDDIIPDKEEIIRNNDLDKKDIQVGTWKYDDETINYDETKRGLRIYSSDVRNTFRQEMKSSIGEKERKKISFSLSDLHSEFYNKSKKSIRDCKPYLETIWELAILCPLPYYGNIDNYPINFEFFPQDENKSDEFNSAIQFIQNRQKRFLKENFRVTFDGIELRRHIQLPTVKDIIPKLYFIEYNDKVFDYPLKFSGYFFAQIPNAVIPLELNGIQIRLRGVGIGGYDNTFIKYYKQIETIRNRWVSGEIFIDEGLESALNIDRDSFNEHDEHFKQMQIILHDKLDNIFNEINSIAKKRSEEKRDKKEEHLKENLQTIIAEESKGKFKLIQQKLDIDSPIIVKENEGEIILNTAANPLKKKKADMIIRTVMLAYHTAKHITETEEEQEKKFFQLVKEIIGELG